MHKTAPRTGACAPVGAGTTWPSNARVYDYSLGGKDNYAVDRAAFDRVLEVASTQREVSLANRRWLHRVARYLAGPAGVDQFLDIGAGLPTVSNLHEILQLENPAATVVYVDNDPLCVAHGRGLLERNDRTHYVQADFLEAGTLLKHHRVRQYFDLDRPIGVLTGAVLHHLGDDLVPVQAMRELIDRLPTGSYVAVTHFYDPGPEHPEAHRLARQLEQVFVESVGSGWYRSHHERGLVDADRRPDGRGARRQPVHARRTRRGAVRQSAAGAVVCALSAGPAADR